MATGLSIITKAMQKVGILVKSESPAADEAADALDSLNDLLSSFSNESSMVYVRVTESFTLTSGTASYTIGAGQTLNTARPISIVQANVNQGVISYNVAPVDDETYQGIQDKTTQGIPYFVNYTNGFPTGTLNFYPVPVSAYTLVLTSEKELTSLTLSGTVSLPPGWQRMLVYNLAVELASEYGQPADALVMKIAGESKAAVARSIMKVRNMDANVGSYPNGFSIYRGW